MFLTKLGGNIHRECEASGVELKSASLEKFDAAVVGGGPAGLIAALLLAAGGAKTICFAPPSPRKDLRTSALMQGSVAILEAVGVWDELVSVSAPLRVMRLIDDTGRLLRAPSVEFNSDELGEEPYGHNFLNVDLVAALAKKATETEHLVVTKQIVQEIEIRPDYALLQDAGGKRWCAELLVAADGRNSMCRQMAGISVTERHLPQTALAFNISHTLPHNLVSTEFHRPNGPLTFVPLPGNRSSVVWVESPEEAERLKNLEKGAFREELQERSYGIFGNISEIDPMGSFPLTHLEADLTAKNRTVLVGEAGHVVPPIGAQGLNLGFRDAATIAELVRKARTIGLSPGDSSVLDEYNRLRNSDISSRSRFVNMLNRSVLSGYLPIQALRGAGLFALANSGPLRRMAMKKGIGPRFHHLSKR